MNSESFDYGVSITLKNPDDFLIIKESLTRMGIASKKSKILYQSCHILHKQGNYFLLHFKELFMLAKKESDFSDDDYRRRNTIAKLLEQWGLCKIINSEVKNFTVPVSEIKIVTHSDKKNWALESKFTVGKKKEK